MLYQCPVVKCRLFFVEELRTKWNVDTLTNDVQNIQTIKTLATIIPGFIIYVFEGFEYLFILTIFKLF